MAGRTTKRDIAEAVRALNAEAADAGVAMYGAARIGSLWRITRHTAGGVVACFEHLAISEAYLVIRGMAYGYRQAREDRHIAVFGGPSAAYAASAEGGDE